MKTRFKRIEKSSVSVFLAVLMLISTMLAGNSATVENENSGMAVTAESSGATVNVESSGSSVSLGTVVYFKHTPSAATYWPTSDAIINVWVFPTSGDGAWAEVHTNTGLTDSSGNAIDYFIVTTDTADKFIILRSNPANYSSSNPWGTEWSRSPELEFQSDSNYLRNYSTNSSNTYWDPNYIKQTSVPSISPGAKTIESGGSVTYTPSITNSTYNTIKSNTFTVEPSEGAIVDNANKKITFSNTTSSNITYTVTDTVVYNSIGYSAATTTATATATVTVTPGTAYENISVAAQKTEDGTNYADTDTPTVTINNGTTAVDVTGSATVAAPATFESGGNTYKFYEWAASAGGTFGNSKSASTTFSPADDGEIATAKYKRCYSVTCSAATNGTISAAESPVAVGENYTINITPDSGYAIDTLTVNGSTVTPTTDTTYTASMPQGGVTVTATFKESVNRIYFYDSNEWGYTHIYFWNTNNNDEKNNTGWPGIAMTPDDTYINLYYIDLPNDVEFNRCIFNNITHYYTGKNDQSGNPIEQNSGGQTSDITVSNFSQIIGKVYNGSSWVTLESLSSTLKEIGDSSYYRVYFYNQVTQDSWKTSANAPSSSDGNPIYPAALGNTYIQYGTKDTTNNTISYSNYNSGSQNQKEFPGKAMIPIAQTSRYNNGDMYYVDIPVSASPNFVRFARAMPENGSNMTKLYDFNSSQNNKILQLNQSGNDATGYMVIGYDDGDHKLANSVPITKAMHGGNWWETYTASAPPQEAVIPGEGEVHVYAKSGTVRDNHKDFNKYSKLAVTEIWADGAAANDAKHGFSGYETQFSYGSSYRVEHAAVKKGTKINITTTIGSDYKTKYYVKAFVINGKSYGIIKESEAHSDTGVYTYSYIVPKDVQAVEITPVYYYFSDGTTKFITFSVEDFAGRVKEKWGNTIACFAWYENGNDDISDGENMAHALGGYPGQPMISEGGSYYMQVPKYVQGLGQIKGITLNNYVWDDVHGMPLRQFNDFNGLNNTVGSYGDDNRRRANAQTYDYDDFVALSDLSDVSEIIFSFKYRTYNNADAAYADGNDGLGNQLDHSEKFGENGWNVLVDYDDHPVDLFGNDLSEMYAKDSNVKALANNQKVFVVSDGYINYYKKSTVVADQVNDNYLGEYATKWNVYTYDGSTYTLRGSLPPSAFITNTTLAAYEKGQLSADNTAAQAQFAHYLPTDESNNVHGDAVTKLFNTYVNLFNAYKGMPVEITYESALNANGRYGAAANPGYRNDGRWYYSRLSSTTTYANTKIYILQDSNATGENIYDYEGTKYLLDEYLPGKNKGTITGATACFDDSELGLPHSGYTSLTNVTKNANDYFQLKADSESIVNEGNKTYRYVFQGWFLDTGGEVLNPITENTKAYRRMTSFADFVAVYAKEEVDATTTKLLHVDHKLYGEQKLDSSDPAAHSGTGSTYVESIIITDDDDNELARETGNDVDSLDIDLSKLTDAKNIIVKVRTQPDNNSQLSEIYEYNESASTVSKYQAKGITGADETTTGKTVTYAYDYGTLFGTGVNTKAYVTIKLFSDLTPKVTTKDIQLEFKFYDRSVVNNATATIKSTPTTLTYTLTDISDYASLKAKLSTFVGQASEEGITFIGDLTNVIDEYYIWSSQTQAIDAAAGLGGHTYYKDDTFTGGTHSDGNVVKYKDHSDYADKKAYHTDYLGNLQTGVENWVTYYDLSGNPISVTGAKVEEEGKATVYNDNVDPATVSKVVLWAFNEPKQYTLTVCTDKKIKLEGETEAAYHGTLKPANEDGLYFFGNEENISYADGSAIAPTFTGFYNQRVGAADTEGAGANHSDDAVGYLTDYFGRTKPTDTTTDIAYTGQVVEAPETAERIITAEVIDPDTGEITQAETRTYYFDGWYIKAENGEYVKLSSDRIYGNRITSDLTIYSMYKKADSYTGDSNGTIGGATATSNGTDVYIDTNNTKNVRLNTQLNVYYNGKNIDNDKNIKQVSVIYVELNDNEVKLNDSNEFAVEEAAGEKAHAWIEANKELFLTQSGDKVRKSGTVTLAEGDTAGHVVIMDTFQNTASTSDNLQITLTSKNRIQFVLPMTSALYDSTYQNLIAFVAIQYEGNGTTAWHVSDNYVSYVHG